MLGFFQSLRNNLLLTAKSTVFKGVDWAEFKHLMERIAARLDASSKVLSQYMTFAKKAMDEINRLHQNNQPNVDAPGEELENDDREIENFMYNGTNLIALGGATFREKALNIANHL